MDMNSIQENLNRFIQTFNEKFSMVLEFVLSRLNNFANISLNEQVSYVSFLVGLLLFLGGVVVSIF